MEGGEAAAWLVVAWDLALLAGGLLLNTAALLLLLRSAGSCHRDGSAPALLSILAANLLHCILVQVFELHQLLSGAFLAPGQLCGLVQAVHAVLRAVPFPTVALQLAARVRGLAREGRPYSHGGVCCRALLVVGLPWAAAAVLHCLAWPAPGLLHGRCPLDGRPPLSAFLAHQAGGLVLPALLLALGLLASLPSLCSCESPATWRARPLPAFIRGDLLLLGTMVAVHLLLQGPSTAVQGFLWYRGLKAEVVSLIVRVVSSLPLILNPLAILLLRSHRPPGHKAESSPPAEEEEAVLVSLEGRDLNMEGRDLNMEGRDLMVSMEGRDLSMEGRDLMVSMEGRDLTMEGRDLMVSMEGRDLMVSMEGRDLETALFASKTTII